MWHPPGDRYITGKEVEKVETYTELRVDVERMWNAHAKFDPIFIGVD